MHPKFEQAYEQHVNRVYGFLAYRARTREDAEDLTQVTFERALRAWPRYNPRRASVATWLLAIARNALIDQRRRERSSGPSPVSDDDVSEAELPRVAGPEEDDIGLSPELAAALGRLRSRDREVLALRFGADLSVSDVAAVVGLSVANVQQILSRTLRKLRGYLEEQEELPQRVAGTTPEGR